MSELEQLRQEAETLRKKMRVRAFVCYLVIGHLVLVVLFVCVKLAPSLTVTHINMLWPIKPTPLSYLSLFDYAL